MRLTCPLGSNCHDAFDSLYGPGSFPSLSSFCNSADPSTTQVLTSTLEFECSVCGLNSYSLGHSVSNGSAGADQVPCRSCPEGGSCVDGFVVATPGFWGVVNSNVEAQFLLCSASYCCDWGLSPCLAIQICAGGRSGPLCGDCGPGLVVALYSPAFSVVGLRRWDSPTRVLGVLGGLCDSTTPPGRGPNRRGVRILRSRKACRSRRPSQTVPDDHSSTACAGEPK